MAKITNIQAFEAIDSRGNPTVAAKIFTDVGTSSIAFVPSGASKGENEAVELRDEDPKRYLGKGVQKAVQNVNTTLRELLIGEDITQQERIDTLMIECDGTPYKSALGANALLAVSLAVAKGAALVKNLPLYVSLGGPQASLLPCPMLNIINGGIHADNNLDFQEFMICPVGATTFNEALRWGIEVFHSLKNILKKQGLITSVGDEGGFAPVIASHEKALELICSAITKAGFTPGKEVSCALDCAATELWDKETSCYIERKKKHAHQSYAKRTSEEQVAYLESLASQFPISSIEDGLAEGDWRGWRYLTEKLGSKMQIVGDDIFVTNPTFLERGIKEGCANAILIKVNQIGTLTETLHTIKMATSSGYKAVISHRSGETEDSFIADLAVATSAGQIKTGAPCRSDRVAKYNRLLEIEQELASSARYAHN